MELLLAIIGINVYALVLMVNSLHKKINKLSQEVVGK